MTAFNYGAFSTGGLKLNQIGNQVPIGPSSPGYVQGTANVIPQYQPQQQVLSAATGPARTGYAAPAAPAPMPDFSGPAQADTSAQLAALNTQYDQSRADLQAQLGSLDTQKANTLSSLDTQLQGVQKQVGTSKQNAQDNTNQNIQDALSTAQDVERSNRNKLRALGILNSSAGGDILSQPLNAYDKQRAQLGQALQQRMGELDDFLNQKTAEHADAVNQIQSQYADLVGKIQSDLRFNERQRADAIQSANAALQQRMAEIQQAQFNYAAQVNALKQSYAQGMTSLASYQQPTADLGAINAQNYNISPSNQNVSQPGIYQEDPTKKLLSGLNS